MTSSVRDLLITGWLIIFVITIGIMAFHPSFGTQSPAETARVIGFSLISTIAGVGLVRYTEILGRSSAVTRRFALGVFVVCMIPLVPVVLITFATPWAALIILTLVYIRWKWALVTSSD
ncbi:MAG: hypothetical protein V3T49_09455 [Dehalococcoidia bacterium]